MDSSKKSSLELLEFHRANPKHTSNPFMRTSSSQRTSISRFSLGSEISSSDEPCQITILSEKDGLVCDVSVQSAVDMLLTHKLNHKSSKSETPPCIWVNVENPSLQDVEKFQSVLDFHVITRDDILKSRIREKWEHYDDYLFLVAHEIYRDLATTNIEFPAIKLLIYKYAIISFHPPKKVRALAICILLRTLSSKIETNFIARNSLVQDLMSKLYKGLGVVPSSSWCLSAVLHHKADNYQRFVKMVTLEVDSIDECILELQFSYDNSVDLLVRLRNASLLAGMMFHMVVSKEKSILSLCKGDHKFIIPTVQLYLRSLYHRFANMKSSLQILKDTLQTSERNFLSATQIHESRYSVKAGIIIKNLTSYGTLYMPGTLITTFIGMNVRVPDEGSDNLIAFWITLAFIVIVSLICYYLFKRQHYFSK